MRAKVHTSWLTQNAPYEEALTGFAERVLTGRGADRFLELFLPFQARIAALGMINSLAQLVLKLVLPGAADFFQGTELWDLSLVDPDNRRPVDYTQREELLAQLDADLAEPTADRRAAVSGLLQRWHDGRIKLLITAELLRLRRRAAALFIDGSYEALEVRGARADHVVALARHHEGHTLMAIVPRLLATLSAPEHPLPLGAACWADTAVVLPSDLSGLHLQDVVTRESRTAKDAALRVGATLTTLPVAVLLATDGM